MSCILVTLEVSHVEMCPYLASVVDESESHSFTAPDRVDSSKVEQNEPLLPVNISVVAIDDTSQHRN